MIVLHECFRDTEFHKRPMVVAFEKKSTIVAENMGFEEKHSGKVGVVFFHWRTFFDTPPRSSRENDASVMPLCGVSHVEFCFGLSSLRRSFSLSFQD